MLFFEMSGLLPATSGQLQTHLQRVRVTWAGGFAKNGLRRMGL